MRDSSIFLLAQLLKEFNYSIDKKQLSLRILSDPDNLVLALTNTLHYFNVKCVVANVPKTALDQLPLHFIAQIDNGKTERLVLVSKEKSKKLKLQLTEEKKLILHEEEFLRDWTGFILAIEKNEKTTKPSFDKDNVVFGILLICACMLLSYSYKSSGSILLSAFLALSFIGLVLSYLTIREKTGQPTFASKYCKISASTSCENVLNSKKNQDF